MLVLLGIPVFCDLLYGRASQSIPERSFVFLPGIRGLRSYPTHETGDGWAINDGALGSEYGSGYNLRWNAAVARSVQIECPKGPNRKHSLHVAFPGEVRQIDDPPKR